MYTEGKLFASGQCTEHFTWEELTRSGTAVRRNIPNLPDASARDCLEKLCRDYLEPLRQHRGRPVMLNSAYRCPQLNAAVGGAPHSWHLKGCAVDIGCRSLEEAADTLRFFRSMLPERFYDECYVKTGHCSYYVHLGVDLLEGQNRLRDNYALVSGRAL